MREPGSFSEMAVRARLGADGLGLGQRVDLWSLVLVTLALIGLVWSGRQSFAWPTTFLLLLSVAAACVQKGLAMRVAFDEAIFRGWAECRRRNVGEDGRPDDTVVDDLRAFDRGLAAAGLRETDTGSLRDLDSRLRGAMKLLGRQVVAFAVQFVTLLAATLAMSLLSHA